VNSEDTPVTGDELGIMKTSCVTKGFFDLSENKRVLDPVEIRRLKEPVSKDSIVISRMNTPALVGLSGLVPQDEKNLFLPDRLWAAKVDSSHSPQWIAQLLASEKVRGQLSDRASGTSGSMKNITKGDVLSLPVTIPSLPEQRKIADFLTAVDGRIGQLSQKKALLEDYKKGVMQQLFTQALRFKDDHGNDFPDWEEKRLGELCSTFKSGKGITSEQIAEAGEFPVFGGNGLRGYTDAFTHDGEFMLIGRQGALCGNINRVSGETHIDIATASCVMTQGIALGGDLNIIRTKLNGVFLAYYLNNACKHAIARVAQGSSVIHLYPDQLKGLSLRFPSAAEQTKIANFLTALDRKIESVSTQITGMQTWKKGLLQQMFV